MTADLQRASITKRFSAALLDFILLTILVTGAATLLTAVLGYETHAEVMAARQDHFEAEYGVKFDITEEDFNKLTEAEQKKYDDAYAAMYNDNDFRYAFNMAINLITLIATFSILVGVVIIELVVPLILKNGQTVGKKIFGICLVRADGVKLTTLQLFTRSVLGKFTIELMIPAYIIILLFFGTANIIMLAILAGLLIGQIICIVATRNHTAIHDLISGTVAVDMASQKIFRSREDLLEYTKKIHADRVNRSDYK
jgi:uncharacterized RDD family membrane protein YckC